MAEAFYCDVLGFTVLAKPDPHASRGGRWFACGAVQLHLGVDEGFRPTPTSPPDRAAASLRDRRYRVGVHILFLCTGNAIRSPLAQGLVTAAARRDGLAITASSAGTLAGERPIDPAVTRWLGDLGILLAAHRSHVVSVDDVTACSVVVGMARAHVRHAVALSPPAWTRAFTLKELVRQAGPVGPRAASEPVGRWLDRVGAGRQPSAMLGDARADDVTDPLGAPARAMDQTLQEVAGLVQELVTLLAPARTT